MGKNVMAKCHSRNIVNIKLFLNYGIIAIQRRKAVSVHHADNSVMFASIGTGLL